MYLYGVTRKHECPSTWIVSTRGDVLCMFMLRRGFERGLRRNLSLVSSSDTMTRPPLQFWVSCQDCLSCTAPMDVITTMIFPVDPWGAGHGTTPIRTTTPSLIPRTFGLAHHHERCRKISQYCLTPLKSDSNIHSLNPLSWVPHPPSLFRPAPLPPLRHQDQQRIYTQLHQLGMDYGDQRGHGAHHQRPYITLRRRATLQRQWMICSPRGRTWGQTPITQSVTPFFNRRWLLLHKTSTFPAHTRRCLVFLLARETNGLRRAGANALVISKFPLSVAPWIRATGPKHQQ